MNSVLNTVLNFGKKMGSAALDLIPGGALAKAIAGGAAALYGAAKGGIKSGEYNRQAEQLIQNQRDDAKRWYNVSMSEDFTQRADVQARDKKHREMLLEDSKRQAARNVVAGGTDEALALAKQGMNKSLAQAQTDEAAMATQYKDNVESQYRMQDAALNQQQAQNYQQMAAATAQAGSQVVNKGLDLLGNALDPDALYKKTEA